MCVCVCVYVCAYIVTDLENLPDVFKNEGPASVDTSTAFSCTSNSMCVYGEITV